MLGMMVCACNPSTQEAEAGEWTQVQGQFGLHCEFKANQDYIVRPCLKKQNKLKMSKRLEQTLL